MDETARTANDRAYASPAASRALAGALAAALAVGAAWRLVGWHRPLWLDETFTGAIAIQPRYAGLVHDCLNELGGPVYYHLMWLWVKVASAGDTVLRLPSLAFSLAAPALILWRGHPDRIVRAAWAAQAALLYILVFYSNEARSYSLQFLMAAAQVMLFAELVRAPRPAPAWGWAAVSVLLALTHYFTLPQTGFQDLCLAAIAWRRPALRRCWPALLLFAPMLAWMAFHLPLLLRFTGTGVAWQSRLTWADLPTSIAGTIGAGRGTSLAYLVLLAAMAIGFARDARDRARGLPPPYGAGDVLAVLAGLGALLAIVAYGVARPSFTLRYVVATLPALTLAPAIWARGAARRWAPAPAVLVGALALVGAVWAVRDARAAEGGVRPVMEWETSSNLLMARGARTVAFLWDDLQTAQGDPALLRRTEGFFFDRAGAGVRVVPMAVPMRPPFPDPNRRLPALLDGAGGRGGLIWAMFQSAGPGALYHRTPPRPAALAQHFACAEPIRSPFSAVLTCIERR